jgi:hypothetical protein
MASKNKDTTGATDTSSTTPKKPRVKQDRVASLRKLISKMTPTQLCDAAAACNAAVDEMSAALAKARARPQTTPVNGAAEEATPD